jgi:Mg-chelatase subunit ChlD
LAIPLPQVPVLTRTLYEPDGATALNDAIADMIRTISKAAPSRATRVLIAILTDGGENSSRTSTDDVASMITYRRTTYDWQEGEETVNWQRYHGRRLGGFIWY